MPGPEFLDSYKKLQMFDIGGGELAGYDEFEPDQTEDLSTDLDSLILYYRDIHQYPILTPTQKALLKQYRSVAILEESVDFWSEIKPEDKIYYDNLFRASKTPEDILYYTHLRQVVSIAKSYIGLKRDLLDVIQEGNFGLRRATKKYDYRSKGEFSTMAHYWIQEAVTSEFTGTDSLIYLPRNLYLAYNKASGLLTTEHISYASLSDEQLRTILLDGNIHPQQLNMVIEMLRSNVDVTDIESTDKPLLEDSEKTLIEFLPDNSSPAPDMEAFGNMSWDSLIETLTLADQRILEKKFVLEISNDAIGKEEGVTGERIRQRLQEMYAKILRMNPGLLLEYLRKTGSLSEWDIDEIYEQLKTPKEQLHGDKPNQVIKNIERIIEGIHERATVTTEENTSKSKKHSSFEKFLSGREDFAIILSAARQYPRIDALIQVIGHDMYNLPLEQQVALLIVNLQKICRPSIWRTFNIGETNSLMVNSLVVVKEDFSKDRMQRLRALVKRRVTGQEPLSELELTILDILSENELNVTVNSIIKNFPRYLKKSNNMGEKVRYAYEQLREKGLVESHRNYKQRVRAIRNARKIPHGKKKTDTQIAEDLGMSADAVRDIQQREQIEGRQYINPEYVLTIIWNLQDQGLAWERGQITNRMIAEEYINRYEIPLTPLEVKTFFTNHQSELPLTQRKKYEGGLLLLDEIRKLMQEGIVETKELAQRLKVDDSTIRKAKRKMIQENNE